MVTRSHLTPPPILFQGRNWSSSELVEMALGWREVLHEEFSAAAAPIAMVMVNRPEAVALFFALSSFPAPLIFLPPEPVEWQSAPPIPTGTRLVLLPGLAELTSAAEQLGLRAMLLRDQSGPRSAPRPTHFLTLPGIVLFTSGSTSRPTPVYRRTARVLAAASDLMSVVGPAPGLGIVAGLPIARALGFNQGLMAATVLGAPLALLERFDPHAVLALFGSGQYQYWAGTPTMADLLSRSPTSWRGTHRAAPICVVAGRIPAPLARRFKERIGVPLRQVYGSTEAAAITVDAGASNEVRSDTAGRPLRDVEIRIGDDPRAPYQAGTAGRIWLSSAEYLMEGYGFPPNVDPLESVSGWWPTPDIGQVDEAGYLTVVGRLDDCFRTNAGQLVNPAAVSAALEAWPGVVDSVAVPLSTPQGPVLGVLVESGEKLDVGDLRRHLAGALPAWAQPNVLDTTRALPRLSNGRTDRQVCIAILQRALDP